MTYKAYADMPYTASNLTFTNQGVSQDTYYSIIGAFHEALIPLVDAGGISIWQSTDTTFSMAPTYGPTIPTAQLNSFIEPVIAKLEQSGMNYTYLVNQYSNFLDSYNAMNPATPRAEIQIGGRLIPRSLVEQDNLALTAAFRVITERGGGASGLALNASNRAFSSPYNSVNPVWRSVLFDMVLYTIYNYTDFNTDLANQQLITDVLVPQLEALTPGGGAYLNEADPQQPDFQHVLYGPNYDRLLAIKNEFDPTRMFYGLTGVGSEYWAAAEDGRLCRTGSG